jgi:hypothetical protein
MALKNFSSYGPGLMRFAVQPRWTGPLMTCTIGRNDISTDSLTFAVSATEAKAFPSLNS